MCAYSLEIWNRPKLACEHEPKPTTQSANSAILLQPIKEIQSPIPAETGKVLKYDPTQLRIYPERRTKWYEDDEKTTSTPKRTTQLKIQTRPWGN